MFSQTMVYNLMKAKIGPSIVYKILASLKGGYDEVKGNKDDFKNFKNDLNCFIGESDAQMFVKKMSNRLDCRNNFTFKFECSEGMLTSLFWADETGKNHFNEFGDIVSFDATYDTNKYKMVFVPFTGIDNHNHCVTFGVGLLSSETAEDYKWLLHAFVDTFGQQPPLVVTDQYPGLKIAIQEVLSQSKHRLCMWHITKKLPGKVTGPLKHDGDFKNKFHNIIWNVHDEPHVFEEKWKSLITEFELENNRWLKDMFQIRENWIPAYFKEVEFSDLMKTTSRSESENSFFGNFLDDGMNLILFMDAFEITIEKQRKRQADLDHQTSTTTPTFETRSPIEIHASKIYTRMIFRMVQKEISESVWVCSQKSYEEDRHNVSCTVREKKTDFPPKDYKINFDRSSGKIDCESMHLVRHGLVCRHVFCMFKFFDINKIPLQQIKRRWRKDIIPLQLLKKRYWTGERNQECDSLTNELFSEAAECLTLLPNDTSKFKEFLQKFKELKQGMGIGNSSRTPLKKRTMMESVLGVSKPPEIKIKNPKLVKNKGSGTGGKRIMGAKEQAILEVEKQRMCHTCDKLCNHDSRNCPLNGGNGT